MHAMAACIPRHVLLLDCATAGSDRPDHRATCDDLDVCHTGVPAR